MPDSKDPRAFHRAGEEATLEARPPTFSPDGAVLIVLSGECKGASARIPGKTGSAVRIGKAPENELVLTDATVSRRHVLVERTSAGLRVSDAGSTNGVRIGGAQIKEALVEIGTVVRAGDVELLIGVELEDVAVPASTSEEFGLAVATSPAMRRIFGVLERAAPTPASVLMIGETGTGKDVLARSIHAKSQRADGPFEVVDCGAVAESLIESELFGHERGAFTGAVSSRPGAFERAEGGTVFLDEIGELALDLQPKLLRVLEAREFRRVGGTKVQSADVRIVGATTKNLRREVQRGAFRDDLYFRLAVVTIEVPPLRKRLEDIPALARRLLTGAGEGAASLRLGEDTVAALKAYDWPGNVRELRNVLERAVHMAGPRSGELKLIDFPPPQDDDQEPDEEREERAFTFDETASYRAVRKAFEDRFERHYVGWLMDKHDGNVSAAARHAQMDRNHLTDLVRKHGLDRRRK